MLTPNCLGLRCPGLLRPKHRLCLRLGEVLGTTDVEPAAGMVIGENLLAAIDEIHDELRHFQALINADQRRDVFRQHIDAKADAVFDKRFLDDIDDPQRSVGRQHA